MRPIHRLNDRKVRNAGEGLHADGGNLLLQVTHGVSGQLNRSWLFRFAIRGHERRMGLGSYPAVSLADAREKAADARKLIAQGDDPIAARDAQRASQVVSGAKVMTFDQCAAAFATSHQASWSVKHAQWWERSIELYASPVFGKLPVSEIDVGLVMKAVEPIWVSKPVLAPLVRSRIE